MSASGSALRRIFTYDGLRIGVTTGDPADLDWLAEFLAPQFGVESQGRPDRSVSLVPNLELWNRLEADGPHPSRSSVECFFLDTKVVRHPLWQSSGAETLVFDEELDVFYEVDPQGRSVRVVGKTDSQTSRLALMRVAREYAMSHVHRDDTLVIHGAALSYGETGLVIAGHKGAGKTSLLVHGLMQREGRYVANDRVVLHAGEDAFVAHGMPTLVKLRRSGLERFPALFERLKASGYYPALTLEESAMHAWGPIVPWRRDEYTLSPAQLCDLLGVSSSARAAIDAVLFPTFTDGTDGVRLERLSKTAAATRLCEALFRASFTRKYGGLFSTRGGHDAPTAGAAADLAARVATRIPCYVCHLDLGQDQPRTLTAELASL